MDLRIFTEPQQGASYDTLLAAARATQDAGFSAFFRSDHYLETGDVSGVPGPTDAWTTLAGTPPTASPSRRGAIGRDVDELRRYGVCGTPSEAVARLREWRDAGAERAYLQVLDLDDLDHVALLGAVVRPAL